MPASLRVGAVSYLNAKPLYHRLTEFAPGVSLEMDYPGRLADRLAEGSLDLALIPSVEYLRGAALVWIRKACGVTGGVYGFIVFGECVSV